MKAFIRTDASLQIGSGHVMRCLTIASNLSKRGYHISFYMRSLEGNLIELVKQHGYSVKTMNYSGEFCYQKDLHIVGNLIGNDHYDLCIIDHYQINADWESEIRQFARKVVVIDDLANRQHNCDLLLDQNFVRNYQNRYFSLVPDSCTLLLGPQYLILRDEFSEIRSKITPRSGEVNRLLVFMGGSDPTNETLKAMDALQNEKFDFEHIDVVVGQGNPNKKIIEQECRRKGYHYHCQISYLADLIGKADFAIGAGGSSTWERCYLGLPSSSTIVADNQLESTRMANDHGLIWNLGWHEEVSSKTYHSILEKLSKSKDHIIEMSQKGLELTNNPYGTNPWVQRFLEIG
ncbi:UDP-2,4-diacetamido-2,4,6-trideoxy-beta-L-altropy ranose hydrolase [Heyndrickxia sporothermodurans]|nr:UDP-2,4-diacetamido-2,4,6-trideoxy-beta-L-altropy ranose hydrolase [Heyndrickxia sporothermodurans]